jgi:hypothetical protein
MAPSGEPQQPQQPQQPEPQQPDEPDQQQQQRTRGRRLGAGRGSAIYEFGPGRVLKCPHDEGQDAEFLESVKAEQRVTEVFNCAGFPAPQSWPHPDGYSMDLVEGNTMLTTLSQKPWLVASLAAELADLHREMASVVAPQWMIDQREWAKGARAAGEERADSSKPLVGRSALHMDLHPGNVMLGPDGKVTVIDFGFWTVGEWQQAAAQTYLVLTTASAADSGFSWWCVSHAVLVRYYRACCWQHALIIGACAESLQGGDSRGAGASAVRTTLSGALRERGSAEAVACSRPKHARYWLG